MAAAFPALGPRPASSEARLRRWIARREAAEAATSRAINSLERKGLLRRVRNEVTGRILLTSTGGAELPQWEQLAQAEEDLAAHCRRTARQWQELAVRARLRADRIRNDRSPDGTDLERREDLDLISRLEGR